MREVEQEAAFMAAEGSGRVWTSDSETERSDTPWKGEASTRARRGNGRVAGYTSLEGGRAEGSGRVTTAAIAGAGSNLPRGRSRRGLSAPDEGRVWSEATNFPLEGGRSDLLLHR